ncbi:MAG: hypothetical protein ACI4DY_08985 [Monoglobaceae bacterium]
MAFCKHRIMDKCRKDNRPCIFSDECFEPEEIKIKTNADRIREMSDEELAKMLTIGQGGFDCSTCAETADDRGCEQNCEERCLKWLQQPAEEV